jgi:hypothetical protein
MNQLDGVGWGCRAGEGPQRESGCKGRSGSCQHHKQTVDPLQTKCNFQTHPLGLNAAPASSAAGRRYPPDDARAAAAWGAFFMHHDARPYPSRQIMWKFLEQQSFHMTREEYDAQMAAVRPPPPPSLRSAAAAAASLARVP